MTTVAIVVQNKDGKILTLKRGAYKKWYPGKWDIISEKLQDDEDPSDGVARGLWEELGIKDFKILDSGDEYIFTDSGESWTVHPFLCEIAETDLELNEEHTECKWVTLEELMQMDVTPPLREDLNVFFTI